MFIATLFANAAPPEVGVGLIVLFVLAIWWRCRHERKIAEAAAPKTTISYKSERHTTWQER